jgi:hypothetical protein
METIDQIRVLLNEVESKITTTESLDVLEELETPWLYDKSLTAYQRVLYSIMVDQYHQGYVGGKQSSLARLSGFNNKTVREGMEALAEKGYVKRGVKSSTWELA